MDNILDENVSQTPTKQIVNTKEELILNIKEWIKLDNELTNLKAEVKQTMANYPIFYLY